MNEQKNLNSKSISLPISAVLAVIYTLAMFASLVLVEKGTTASWKAAFLGIGWRSVAGIEIGLLIVVVVSCTITLAFTGAYRYLSRKAARKPPGEERVGWSGLTSGHVWSPRILITLIMIPLTLFGLRLLLTAMSSIGGTSVDIADQQGTAGQGVSIGRVINTAYRESEPTFTADGRTMYFNCYNGDICVSHLSGAWEQGNWSPPERLGSPISTEYEEVEPLVNPSGDKLYFMSRRPAGRWWRIPFLSPFMDVLRVVNTLATNRFGRTILGGWGLSDVYVSSWVDGAWSEPRSLNDVPGEPAVNTPFADHCLSFSADGQEVFWTSTRPGGYGGNDIWTARQLNGQWSVPENLGPNVNSSGDDHHSIPGPDGRVLYVTSTRAGGYGNDDNYLTTRDAAGAWGPLVNLGPQINGPGDDRCPVWTPDHKIFLFDSVEEHGMGSRDIWWVYFKDVMGNPHAMTSDGSH